MIIAPILAPSCKLKLARFSAKLRIQDGAECGNIQFLELLTQLKIKENIQEHIMYKSYMNYGWHKNNIKVTLRGGS